MTSSWVARALRGTADSPCFENTERYVDCGNGTVTDMATGLVWLQDASLASLPGLGGIEEGDYNKANEAASLLRDGICGLNDGSRPGDWRLPTREEWQRTIDHASSLGWVPGATAPKGPPTLTDDTGSNCFAEGGPTSFYGLPSSGSFFVWSAGVSDPPFNSGDSTWHAWGCDLMPSSLRVLRIESVGGSPRRNARI